MVWASCADLDGLISSPLEGNMEVREEEVYRIIDQLIADIFRSLLDWWVYFVMGRRSKTRVPWITTVFSPCIWQLDKSI